MIWSVSWKNVWRNKLRSGVVIVAVTLGLMGGVFSAALMEGMMKQRVASAVNVEVSHIQIHDPAFEENSEVQYTIKDADKMQADIKALPEVRSVSERTVVEGMASYSSYSSPARIIGIEPEKEMQVSKIYEAIGDSAGYYFENAKRTPIVIGEKMAKNLGLIAFKLTESSFAELTEKGLPVEVIEKLRTIANENFRKEKGFEQKLNEILGESDAESHKFWIVRSATTYKIGKRLVLSMQGPDGNPIGGSFRLNGVYRTSNSMFDMMYAFVRKNDLIGLAGVPPAETHEVAIMLNNIEDSKKVADNLKVLYPALEKGIKTWGELRPDLAWAEYMGVVNYVLVMFILFALGFGIVNTMLMVVLERVKELGMLMAVGMNKLKIFSMIMLESVFLSLTGGTVGLALSALLVWYFNSAGIDLSAMYGEGFAAIGYNVVMYPSITNDFYFGVAILVILTGIIAAIYPARKALKLNPADAIRSDN